LHVTRNTKNSLDFQTVLTNELCTLSHDCGHLLTGTCILVVRMLLLKRVVFIFEHQNKRTTTGFEPYRILFRRDFRLVEARFLASSFSDDSLTSCQTFRELPCCW
jgi:hypothetical protein